MNFDATTIAQAVGGPPEVIGHGSSLNDPRQAGFEFGWNSARGSIYELEMNEIGSQLWEELRFGPADAAEEIASLYNSVAVGESMIRQGFTFDLWRGHIFGAIKALRERHGIKVIGYYDDNGNLKEQP